MLLFSNKKLKIIIKIFLFLIFFSLTYLQAYEDCNLCFNTPWTFSITSDYGPRNVESGTWFHRGIDYGMPRNTLVTPVEGGIITKIDFSSDKGWYIDIILGNISNSQRIWHYYHIFSGTTKALPVYSCQTLPCTSTNRTWELRNATLVNPNNENDIKNSLIIIQWNGNYALNIYCMGNLELENLNVRNADGTYIMSNNTTRAITRSNVEVGVPFAPSGNSGSSGSYHLHLGVNNGDDNPLRYMVHTPDENPTLIINNPPDRHIITGEELLLPYPITITVNSTGGLDLDKVDVWVYKNESENIADRIHLPVPFPVGVQNTFQYGGVPGEYKTSNIREFSQNNSSVIPIGNEPGTDKFILYQTFKDLNLPAGKHKLVVKAEDVNGNSTYAQSSFYIVPSDYALYRSGVVPTPGPTGTPVAGTQYTNVVVKDLKQEPTEEPTEVEGTVTPSGSAVPSPTTTPEITEVPIKDYLKNVLYGLVGDANFSDVKYKE